MLGKDFERSCVLFLLLVAVAGWAVITGLIYLVAHLRVGWH